MFATTPPPVQFLSFSPAAHNGSLILRAPKLSPGAKFEIVITSPHSLRRGPVKYEGGCKRQRLAAAAFPYNSPRHYFAGGLALNAGGDPGCVVRAGQDVCHTLISAGFLRIRHVHWRALRITIFKPARQATHVRISLRSAR